MSGDSKNPPKRSHKENGSAFPDDLEIPVSALHDRKFLSSYVHILNDPRVYKRQRLNGDRTSSRFDVDYNCHINVVFNEPVIKRRSILTNTLSPKEKNPDDSGIRKSVSFLSKITFIDAVELDGGSSDWTDIDVEESVEISKMKSKTKKDPKVKNNVKKGGTSNGIPSNKNHKKKTKDKSSSKKGNKVKSPPKELFKFKITKPFRKFGRSKEKKLKHLQKKFGRRMFKAFVHVKRSFNLKHIPDQVSVPLEKISMNKIDVSTPKKSAPSIQDFLIGQMTKKVKVCITPVLAGDTNEEKISDTEITEKSSNENDVLIQNSRNTENEVRSDSHIDRNGTHENTKSNQNIVVATSTKSLNADQTTKINGDMVPALSNDSPDMTLLPRNDREPSPELVTSSPLPNKIDKITCNMYYNTNKDETVTMNGQVLETNNDHHIDLVDNISSLNVSFSMPTNSLTDNILGCDASEIASIQLNLLND